MLNSTFLTYLMQKIMEKDPCVSLRLQLQKDRDRIQTSLKVRLHLQFCKVKKRLTRISVTVGVLYTAKVLYDETCFNPVVISRGKNLVFLMSVIF